MKHLLRMVWPAVLLAGMLPGTAAAQAIDSDSLRNGPKVVQAFRGVVAGPSQYTVRVLADGREVAFGTIVDRDGYILTKASELRGQVACRLYDGKVLPGKLVGVHDAFDLALLKIEAHRLPRVEWRNCKDLKVGQWVVSVGMRAEPVGVGFVSVAPRTFKAGDQPAKFFNPGAGWLGVYGEPSLPGVKLTMVSPNGPAQKAGLKANDIVVQAAGRTIPDMDTFGATIQSFGPGATLALKVRRGEEELDLLATLGKLPPGNLGNPQETMGTTLSKRRGGFPVILQHDSGLRPEDCGGPLVDLDGKTVAINISRAGRTETYAIPSEEVLALLEDLKSGRLAPKAVEPLETSPRHPELILRGVGGLDGKDQASKLVPGAYMKVHELYLAGGATYEIALHSTDFDSYLAVEELFGNKLAEDVNSGSDLSARIVFRPAKDGNYRLIASTVAEGETGRYTLTVRKLTDTTGVRLRRF
jgi:serine protease Do